MADDYERYERPNMERVVAAYAEHRAKPREDESRPDPFRWYLERLISLDRSIKRHCATGDFRRALNDTALFAETWKSLELTVELGYDAEAGRKLIKGGRAGGRMRGSSDKILDRKTKFFSAYDDAIARNVLPIPARQHAAKAAGYNDDHARRLLRQRYSDI